MSGRILVVNPNSSKVVTAGIDAAMAPLRIPGGPEIECVSLEKGPPGIENEAHVAQVVPLVAEAVRATMAGLHRTLAHLGLSRTDVVQIKAFISPFSDHAAAVREVASSFGGAPVPPLVLVEWVSTLPAEIELIASARVLPAPAGDRVAWLPLPWLTVSPRYCRVSHVGAGVPLIFLGGIDGDGGGDARGQMKLIFERVGSALYEAGASYRNLIKATYYLGDARARAELGDIRGVYFDPTRAPAASALETRSLGVPGRTALIDLIAFPVK